MSKLHLVFFRFALLGILLFNIQCKNTEDSSLETEQETTTEFTKITAQDIKNIKFTEYVLSDLAKKEVTNWSKFKDLEIQIENLKNGILSFFKDDKTILQGFITDLKNQIPENLNSSSIIVRLSVLETAMYKFDETINLQSSTKEAVIKDIENLLLAHNNVVYQVNKVLEKKSQNIIKP
ncbi:hypothetical protein [Pontimicrobium sp. SW4]|uniref:Uncharacterized protein n=1 Tax=Pontimicrobium sp. SW4 TaxID=3153519 RepID=A0AAU7BU43_9FLAO